MKMKVFALIGVCFLFSSCMSITSGVSSKYDEFTNTTIYRAKATLATITPLGWFHLLGFVYEKDLIQSCFLGFEYSGPSWYFFDRIYLIIDNDNFNFSSDNNSRDVLSGGNVSEFITFSIDREIIERIAYSTIVKFKVTGSKGSFTYQLNESEKEYFKELLVMTNSKIDKID